MGNICERGIGLEPGVKETGSYGETDKERMWWEHEQAGQRQRDWNGVDGEN